MTTHEVVGKNYDYIHVFPNEVKINENKKYLVKYSVDNLQIAYIFSQKYIRSWMDISSLT